MNATSVSILDQLRREHRACQERLEAMRAALSDADAGDPDAMARASAQFAALREELRRHYLREELGLFPLLNQYRTMVLLQVEHDDIQTLEDALGDALRVCADRSELDATQNALNDCFERYCERLQSHVREEETGVFTLAAEALEPEELALATRKGDEALAEDAREGPLALDRPSPTLQLHDDSLFAPNERPIVYATTFQEEQASVQRLRLQAGAALTRHWSAQYQYMALLSGAVTLSANESTLALTPGQAVTLSPRYAFSMTASEDSCLLVAKVWPRPHFRRARR